MKIDNTISDEDVPNDSVFWQYKVYADIRGGSQDLCKFSLHFKPALDARILRIHIPHAFSLSSSTVLFMTVPIDQYGCGGL